MRWLEKMTGGYTSSAKVVDGALVLSLPDAVSPIVWRMELEDVKAAALEIETKDSVFILILKEGKADKKEIAPFDSRTKAVKALMAASSALENAHSSPRANDNHTIAPATKEKGNNLVSALIALIILAAIIFGITRMGPNVRNIGGPAGNQGDAQTSSLGSSEGTPGKPQSADEFLMGR